MPKYYIDLGRWEDGLILAVTVEADSREEAVRALQDMIEYRLGGGDEAMCEFEVDGGRLGKGTAVVNNISVFINPDAITVANVTE